VTAEMLERCDAEGRPLGPVRRDLCHGNPAIIHLTVHLHVFDPKGRLYLQKRSRAKDLYPGRWDTAVGGHVNAGEGAAQALLREAREELGIDVSAAWPLYAYLHSNSHESEYVHSHGLRLDGPLRPNPEEIEEGRFFTREEIEERLGRGVFTPNFEGEYARLAAAGVFATPRP
jgi:isopentenyldiphosphate isomerase